MHDLPERQESQDATSRITDYVGSANDRIGGAPFAIGLTHGRAGSMLLRSQKSHLGIPTMSGLSTRALSHASFAID